MQIARPPVLPRLILADDLSGAAEAAAAFGGGTRVALRMPATGSLADAQRVTVLDTDTRASGSEEASLVIARAVSMIDRDQPLVKKVDSLLRGNVSAELAPLLRAGRTVVLAPALPELGRATVGGVITINGIPLHESGLWLAESTACPRSLSELLEDLPHTLVELEKVRGHELGTRLRETRGSIVVCDAENADDLTSIGRAALTLPSVALAGSSALCRVLTGGSPVPWMAALSVPGRHCLTVVGTASPAARQQVQQLTSERPASSIELSVDALLSGGNAYRREAGGRISRALSGGDLVITLEPIKSDGPRPSGPALTNALGDIVARSSVHSDAGPTVDLVLTGGETARAVLDALDVAYLDVIGQTEPGAVVSSTPNGARVGTRPGSFGGPASLATLRRSLRGAPSTNQQDDLPKNTHTKE